MSSVPPSSEWGSMPRGSRPGGGEQLSLLLPRRWARLHGGAPAPLSPAWSAFRTQMICIRSVLSKDVRPTTKLGLCRHSSGPVVFLSWGWWDLEAQAGGLIATGGLLGSGRCRSGIEGLAGRALRGLWGSRSLQLLWPQASLGWQQHHSTLCLPPTWLLPSLSVCVRIFLFL